MFKNNTTNEKFSTFNFEPLVYRIIINCAEFNEGKITLVKRIFNITEIDRKNNLIKTNCGCIFSKEFIDEIVKTSVGKLEAF